MSGFLSEKAIAREATLRRHCFLCHKEPISHLQIYCRDCLWKYHEQNNWCSRGRKNERTLWAM